MTTDSSMVPELHPRSTLPPSRSRVGAGAWSLPALGHGLQRISQQDRLRAALQTAAALVCVVLIASLDYGTGPYLSFGIFYLIPVAACAWWCGFAPGVLLSFAASIAWS